MFTRGIVFGLLIGLSNLCIGQGPSELCDLYAPILMDAQLNIRSAHANLPHETPQHFMAMVGTNGGEISTQRGLIAFDLSALPANVQIDSAFIYFTYRPSPANYTHDWTSGSNEALLQRVIESWSASTVTWNNAPGVTSADQATIPATINTTQNSGYIEITPIVQKWVTEPDSNFGLLFRLLTEEGYRRQTYASSDDPSIGKHPKLRVVYKCNQLSTPEIANRHPLLTDQTFFRLQTNERVSKMRLIDIQGKTVRTAQGNAISHSQMAAGIYILQVEFEVGATWNRKVFVP